MDRRFIGSNVALVFGLFLLFAIFAPPGKNLYAVDAFIDGLCIIAGALAYKSAKKRKLGIVKNAKYRQYTEIIGLALIVILAGLLLIKRNNFYVNYTVIVWAVSSYLTVSWRRISGQDKSNNGNNLNNGEANV